MKFTALSACLLASSLLTLPAFAQDQAAADTAQTATAAAPASDSTPAGAATDATPTATAEAPATTAPAAAAAPAEAAAPVESAAATPAAAAPASAFSPEVTAAIGTPEPGKALVVFFRPSHFVGGGVGFIVREGETELGKLRNGTYFAIQVEPGAHAYVVHSENKDLTNTEVEAGETYFLSGSVGMGVMVGRPNLSPSDETAFAAILPKLKKAKPLN